MIEAWNWITLDSSLGTTEFLSRRSILVNELGNVAVIVFDLGTGRHRDIVSAESASGRGVEGPSQAYGHQRQSPDPAQTYLVERRQDEAAKKANGNTRNSM